MTTKPKKAAKPNAPTIVRECDVLARFSLSKSGLRRIRLTTDFPAPVSLGLRAVGWRVSDLDAWEAALPTARPLTPPAKAA